MKKFVRYLKNGKILSINSCADDDYKNQPGFPDELLEIEQDQYVDLEYSYIYNNSVVQMPAKPSFYYYFDYVTKQWVIDEAQQAKEIIQQRNLLLSQSDWTQLPDVPLANKAGWVAYRQALRDVPLQPGYPESVTWPTKPSDI